jgi:hypothetical protein
LAKELSDWREEYWQGHADEINKTAEELKGVLTDVIYNDMSAIDAEERGIGATELARQTLASADLAGIGVNPRTQVMVQALRDIVDADRAKEPHVIAEEALKAVGDSLPDELSDWRELGEKLGSPGIGIESISRRSFPHI